MIEMDYDDLVRAIDRANRCVRSTTGEANKLWLRHLERLLDAQARLTQPTFQVYEGGRDGITPV